MHVRDHNIEKHDRMEFDTTVANGDGCVPKRSDCWQMFEVLLATLSCYG